jgi:iron complex outermembrane recepter protein
MKFNLLSLCPLPFLVVFAGQALAQEKASLLEEVIVTAERRAQNIQDVPIAVQAFTADQLSDRGVVTLANLQMVTPNLVITDSTNFVIPFIRGTGSSTIAQGIYSSVATYVDDVYIARQTSATFDLDNVESVQVLAGPQGALYGRNATAGALVITTPTPSPGDELSGKISATYGDYDNQALSGRLSGSLGEQFAGLISASWHQRDGFIDNENPPGFGLYQEDTDDRDSYSVAGVLNFEPNDRLSMVLRGSYYELKDRSGCCYQAVGLDVFPGIFPGLDSNQTGIAATVAQLVQLQYGLPPGVAAGLGASAGATAQFTQNLGEIYDGFSGGWDNGLLKGKHPGGSGFYIDGTLASLVVNYEFDSFALKSISSYTDSTYNGSTSVSLEGPGLAVPAFGLELVGGIGFSAAFPSETYQQEFRLVSDPSARIPWIAGITYFQEDGKTDLTGDFFGTSLWSARNDFTVKSMAAYAQFTYPVTEAFGVTLGGRFTDEDYDLDDRFDPSNPLSFPGTPNVGSLGLSDSNATYLVRGEYNTTDWLGYASISSGFKSGSLNSKNPSSGSADPEEITSYELGFKSDLVDWLRFNTAVYYYDYQDIQQNIIDDGSGATFLINGGSAEVKGLDVEFTAVASDKLIVYLSATLLDSKFTDDAILPPDSVLPIDGNWLPGAPEFAANLSFDWTLPFVSDGELLLTAMYSYSDGYYFEPENRVGTGGSDADSFSVLNFNLKYTSSNQRWSIAAWGNNVLDEDYYRTGVVAAGFLLDGIAGNPAHFGVTGSYEF